MKAYKTYKITLKDSILSEIPLLAKNNREALKLAGKFIKGTKLYICKIIDDKGGVILSQWIIKLHFHYYL